MSHIFTDDGKQWKLIPVMPVKPIIPDNPNNIIGLGISEQAQYAGRLEAAKANALPVVNPELIGDTKKLSFIADKGDPFYEWPGTWELIIRSTKEPGKFKHAKLIAPQQPQAEKTDNELIAEFMGIEHGTGGNGSYTFIKSLDGKYVIAKYDISWDWLMPVVEKIESIEENMHVVINRNMCHVQFVGSTHRCESKIQAVYQAVVEFIKWYNTQPKQL